MFRAQIPPRPLDHAISGFLLILEERFGAPAALESQVREYLAILRQEMGHPSLLLTNRQFDRATERALTRLLASKR